MSELSLGYTPAQKAVFFEDTNIRFKTIAKGRRLGFTRGCANYCVECLLDESLGTRMILWVDTIQGNLQNYFTAYFLPLLKQLPADFWHYEKQSKTLTTINGGILHLRSAERPENIEGLGYDLIILNEAGIILNGAKGDYLWDNAISPMLLDNPNSKAIIGGVPKGKNKFYKLAMQSAQNWKHYKFSSYDNPLLKKDEINRLVDEMGGKDAHVAKQEIYGEFIDNASNSLFNLTELEQAQKRSYIDEAGVEVWGVDVARYGDDKSVIARRKGDYIYSIKSYTGLSTTQLASEIYHEYQSTDNKPEMIFIDSVGIGAGVVDRCRELGLNVYEANVSAKSSDERYLNKRAQMYFTFSQRVKYLSIVPNAKVLKQAGWIEYFYNDNGKLQLLSKEAIKKLYGASPDELDALALTFFEPVIKIKENEYSSDNFGDNFGW